MLLLDKEALRCISDMVGVRLRPPSNGLYHLESADAPFAAAGAPWLPPMLARLAFLTKVGSEGTWLPKSPSVMGMLSPALSESCQCGSIIASADGSNSPGIVLWGTDGGELKSGEASDKLLPLRELCTGEQGEEREGEGGGV